MCGIVGTSEPADHPRLSRMLNQIAHRGPDDEGTFLDPPSGLAMGMRRLSILDQAGGQQPMCNEDKTVWVVFNGEIYNSPELRSELEAKGHLFRTRNSDTEVLVHLYEVHGEEMVSRLNGMFSFVIYDVVKRQLFGARDRIGIKPFYYAHVAGRFAFASELKCLCCLPWVSREVDFTSFYHYLSLQFVPAPRSILSDVKKLPAGHRFVFDLQQRTLRTEKYWQLPIRPDSQVDREEIVHQLRARFVESVRLRTLSDVPIACSLSGGLDSSAVVGGLAQTYSGRLRTYSLGFSDESLKKYNELPLARKVAERWGTEHHEVVIKADTLLTDLDSMVWHLDEPYGGGLPSWYIYKRISEDCKVVLTGTGGDELFGNYGKWQVHERTLMRKWWRSLRQSCRWRSLKLFHDALRFPHGHLYHRYFTDAAKDAVLLPTSRVRPNQSTEVLLEDMWEKSGTDNARDAVASIDFQMQLAEEFLVVTDRFSMAHSVEARVPFLDHDLVQLAYTIPAALRTRRGDPKYLEKKVIEPLVPSEVLDAPKKGFELPLKEWTRCELREMIGDLLGPEALSRQGLLSPNAWKRVVEPHLTGRMNFTPQVWTLLMFQIWHLHLQTSGGFANAPQRQQTSESVPVAA